MTDNALLAALVKVAASGVDAIVRAAGQRTARHKEDGSLLTEADLWSNEAILKAAAAELPGVPVHSEETPLPSWRVERQVLVVDPLDGTTNFSRGLGLSSVSAAVIVEGRPHAAVVAPLTGGCYFATQGGSSFYARSMDSWRTADRIRCQARALRDSVLHVACDQGNEESRRVWWRWLTALRPPTCFRLRIVESAALELCWLAAGRVDGYLHPSDQAWDVAAGALIAAEAGAAVRSAAFGDWDIAQRGIAALTPGILEEVRRLTGGTAPQVRC
jgi:fructose-1,6-bisphosphatase/inositol monophosphatase family enzyme